MFHQSHSHIFIVKLKLLLTHIDVPSIVACCEIWRSLAISLFMLLVVRSLRRSRRQIKDFLVNFCNTFVQFGQLFKVRVSNYQVRASNPLLVIPKKFSAANDELGERGTFSLSAFDHMDLILVNCDSFHDPQEYNPKKTLTSNTLKFES